MFFLDTEEALDVAPAPLPLVAAKRQCSSYRQAYVNRKNIDPKIKSAVFFNSLNPKDLVSPSKKTYSPIATPSVTTKEGIQCVELNVSPDEGDRFVSNIPDIPATDDFTLIMQVFGAYSTTYHFVVGQYAAGQAGRFYVRASGANAVTMFDGSVFSTFTGSVVPYNRWSTIVIRRHGNIFNCFINGVKSIDVTSTVSIYQGVGTQYGGVSIPGLAIRGWMSFAAHVRGAASDGECISISNQPFRLFNSQLDLLPLQSRNVPGGYALPAAFEQPRSMIPGVKPTWPVEVDWLYQRNILSGYITGVDLPNNSILPVTLAASAGSVVPSVRNGIQATDIDLSGYQRWAHVDVQHNIETAGATLVCRFFCDSIESWGAVFCFDCNDANNRLEVTKSSSGKIFLQYQNSWQKTYVHDYPVGKWVTFVGVKHAGTQSTAFWFAEDGGSIKSDGATGLVAGLSRTYNSFYIGASPTGLTVRRFDGLLDFAFVLDQPISESRARRIIANPYQFLKIKGT